MDVQITSSDDSSIVLATLGKGSFFGETALFFWPARRSAGVRASVRLSSPLRVGVQLHSTDSGCQLPHVYTYCGALHLRKQ